MSRIWRNVKLNSKLSFVIDALYMHPESNALDFCEKLNATVLDFHLNKNNTKSLLLGDVNLKHDRMQSAPSCERLFEHTGKQCSFSPCH